MTRRVSVVGLGKLGASMAAATASRGHDVVGVDVDPRAVARVREGRAPVDEAGLDDLIRANRSRLRATTDFADAIDHSDLTFVIVPTPSDARGAFSLTFVADAFREIGRALARKPGYHTVALTSTVLPGASRFGLIPVLEQASGKRCGADFGFCYSPEFVALGTVIRDFLHPDFLLIGEFDEHSGHALAEHYGDIIANDAPIARMSLENAELAKISLNAYVTMKITFANMLADICDRLPGGDVDAVSAAIGLDPRIGRRYLTGGLGFGGPCFPRDNIALGFLAQALGVRAELPLTTHALNRSVATRIADVVASTAAPGARVAVLGLSYKPGTHVTEESQAVDIVTLLVERGYRVSAFDPLAGGLVRGALGDRVQVPDTLAECLRAADVVVIANPDPMFAALSAADFTTGERNVVVVDLWRLLAKPLTDAPGVRYVARGRGADAISEPQLAALWTVE
jgi:UDPglucose 6-dehydrogenase